MAIEDLRELTALAPGVMTLHWERCERCSEPMLPPLVLFEDMALCVQCRRSCWADTPFAQGVRQIFDKAERNLAKRHLGLVTAINDRDGEKH